MPSVGIITVNYNSAAFIGKFIESIIKLDYEKARLIVVDAGSIDGSREEIASRLPDAHVISCDENVGTARGNNIGIDFCRQEGLEYVLVLNNDTTHAPNFLSTLMAGADEHTMTVPRILLSKDRSLISTHAGDFDWFLGLFRNTYNAKPDGPATQQRRDIQTASFCCLLAPLSVFDEIGLLDEQFFMYYEETDFLRKALDRGYRLVYEPDAVIYHDESASSGGGWMTPFKQYYASRNRMYLVHKHARSRLRYALFTAYFWAARMLSAPRYFMPRQRALFKAQVLGMLHYYQGRMGRTLEVHDF
ncbi:MAG: glycosyltransferase family 2 protein [Chloroflexi bacterium]|nr:glycosyltransferase family 2 protein [Chloroflexota bacterium]